MIDLSNVGVSARLIASKTFPMGFTITEWADDTNPLDIPSLEISTPSMNINGELISVSSPVPTTITLAVLPGSEADINLSILLDANRPSRFKRHVGDVITLVVAYPKGDTITLVNGIITGGTPGKGVSSAGRSTTSTYGFAFEAINRTRVYS